MTAETKVSVKQRFETGDTPTQSDFINLIDSYQDTFDILQAIGTAAQAGLTGVVIIESSADATVAAIGATGKLLISVGTTASAVAHLNAMTTDTTQSITGNKTFSGLFRVTAGVTVKNERSPTTVRLINTDATAGSTFTPRLTFSREYESTDFADGVSLGGLQWEGQASAAAAGHTWGQLRVDLASAAASAGGSQFTIWTRDGGTLSEAFRVKKGIVIASATGDDLGAGTVNAGKVFDDGRQIAPSMQAFAWAQVNETGTPAVVNGINIASITDNAAGDMSLVFSTAASDTAYGVQIFIGGSTASSPPTVPRFSALHTTTAGGVRFLTLQGLVGASGVDFERVTVTIWDDNPSQGTRVA
jgi:hypothetical protein